MLKDLAAKYYQQGYNCAETIIRAGNEYYNLELDENAFRITGAFGGGLQVGDVCGALTGAICAIASRYVETKAHDTPALAPLTKELVRRFQAQFHALRCAEIKPQCFQPATRCLQTVHQAADLLEGLLTEWDARTELL